MGRRQRLTEFIAITDEELLALIEDRKTPQDIRRRAITEAKYRGLRNRRKRRKETR